jgi:hypothetical protein
MNDTIFEIVFDNDSALDAAALITAHVMEFIEWLCYGNHPFVHWFDENGHYFTDELTPQRWSIEQLYEHWTNNIKK